MLFKLWNGWYIPLNLYELIPAIIAFVAIDLLGGSLCWWNKNNKLNKEKRIVSLCITIISVVCYLILVILNWNIFAITKIIVFLAISFGLFRGGIGKEGYCYIFVFTGIFVLIAGFICCDIYNKKITYTNEPTFQQFDFRLSRIDEKNFAVHDHEEVRTIYIREDGQTQQNTTTNYWFWVLYFTSENQAQSFNIPDNEFTKLCYEPIGQEYYYFRQIYEKQEIVNYNTDPATIVQKDIVLSIRNELHIPEGTIDGLYDDK